MKLKPQDFFIGVIDFFSVILPGALVTYFLKGLLYIDVFGNSKVFPLPVTEVQRWFVFLLAAYIIGHLIFIIASFLLDKYVYDRFLRNRYFKKNFNLSYHTATAKESKTIITPNAIIPLPSKSSFEISNEQQEPLMFLTLK